MNKFYLIVPVVLLGAFIFYYSQFSQQLESKRMHDQEIAAQKAEQDKENKDVAAQKANEEAQALQQKQREADERTEADREQAYQDKKQKVIDEIGKYKDEADKLSQQAASLQTKLDSLHAAHENATRALFALQKDIELEKISRRDADMEIQRTYDIVTQKVAVSPLATYIPPPAPAQN